jgi:dihydrofolate reductase
MAMGKLTMTAFVTLDGVMQAPGGPEEDTRGNFRHGGWLVPYFDDQLGQIASEAFTQADAFLLGRYTYEVFAAHWPRVTSPDDVIAGGLNRLPKHVVSTTLDKVEWHNSSLVRGDVPKEIASLKRRYDRELQVHGSCGLAQTLLENDLLDELRLWTFPLVLGSGKRLFGAGTVPASLVLGGTTASKTGVVVSTYRRVGKPTYGSFALDG